MKNLLLNVQDIQLIYLNAQDGDIDLRITNAEFENIEFIGIPENN